MENTHKRHLKCSSDRLTQPVTNKCSSILHSFRPCYWIERWNLIQRPYKIPLNSWLCFLSQQSQQPEGTPHLSPVAAEPSPHSITGEWVQGTAPDEDASLCPKQPVLSPRSFQTVTALGIPVIHLQSESGTCSVTTGFDSFTQVQLLLRG